MTDKFVKVKKEAVALSYDDHQMVAPTVVAKGKGDTAERILAQAKAHGIPVQEDETLVELLGKLNMNQQIPEELFQVVAEVFAFIYRLDKKTDHHQEESV